MNLDHLTPRCGNRFSGACRFDFLVDGLVALTLASRNVRSGDAAPGRRRPDGPRGCGGGPESIGDAVRVFVAGGEGCGHPGQQQVEKAVQFRSAVV